MLPLSHPIEHLVHSANINLVLGVMGQPGIDALSDKAGDDREENGADEKFHTRDHAREVGTCQRESVAKLFHLVNKVLTCQFSRIHLWWVLFLQNPCHTPCPGMGGDR